MSLEIRDNARKARTNENFKWRIDPTCEPGTLVYFNGTLGAPTYRVTRDVWDSSGQRVAGIVEVLGDDAALLPTEIVEGRMPNELYTYRREYTVVGSSIVVEEEVYRAGEETPTFSDWGEWGFDSPEHAYIAWGKVAAEHTPLNRMDFAADSWRHRLRAEDNSIEREPPS